MKLRKYAAPYMFIAPFFILFIVFQFVPMVWSFWLSFRQWNGLGPTKFIGLENYTMLFRDAMFRDAFFNTLYYWFFSLILVLPIAFMLASLLAYGGLKKKNYFQTALFIPHITASVAAALVFSILFDDRGFINQILGFFGINPLPWLTSTGLSKLPVLLLIVWRNAPWYMMIIYSGLIGINPELYEAAYIDGASAAKRFIYITIPCVAPILFFSAITLSIESWRVFNEPYVLTKGGPGSSSLSLVQYMYENGFRIFKMGYASTIGYALTAVLLLVSVVQARLMKNQSGGIWGSA
ncbi:carbohydrate ABC transporter permease [Breznakiella homolactica]|uniref:Sugar ABC transporter permease n=1 Tax=Breznakiella homolactica TaxID=2798577 RepID=A0A7T7XPU5_9SPIR|nr:sugar ABC transporter permease [Breznakiella homolactica]QQO10306.1 sugar ABC transporter permease [Breznakiella homolactica]